jgi:hypothetical protein
MNFTFRPAARFLLSCFCLTALLNAMGGLTPILNAQEPAKPQSDDVLRINTDLVQTAVTVVDKDGRFVDGVDRSKFELTVDGKPRPISFFERVTAGSAREEQLATRADPGATATNAPPTVSPTAPAAATICHVEVRVPAERVGRSRCRLRTA